MIVPRLWRPAPRHYVSERISSVGIRSMRAGSIGSMGHAVNEMRNSDRTPPRVYVRGLHIYCSISKSSLSLKLATGDWCLATGGS